MQANLPNVYAFLLERFGEQYSIAYTTAPTYLKSIVGHEAMEKKIVFLYVEERKGNQTSSPIILTKPKAADDLDLTGSPLKDNCLINGEDVTLDLNMMDLKSCAITPWKLEEEYHRGIDVNKARNAICSKLFQQDQFCNDQGSVWILCNGKDSEKVLLLQVELNSEFNSRGIVTYQGVTPVSELTSVQPLLRKHCSGIRPGSAMETFIENVYEIKSNDIKVHCSWTTSVSLPALINLASCDIILSQTFRLCECCPLTHDLIEQLRILTSIREDILIYKEAEANNQIVEPVYRCGCGMERADLKDAISKVMTEVSGFAENEIVTDIENDIEAVVRMAKLRRSTDLTDKLWDILKRCSNYKELKTAFQLLFQCSARFNIINMPTNKNRLAEIITEVSNRRLAIPCLTGTEPLELLLEIGLEKLYKDYEFIFMQSKICTPTRLKKAIMTAVNKTENGNALSSVRKSLRNAIPQQETVTPRKTLLHNVNGAGMRKPYDEIIGFKNSYFDEIETAVKITKLLQIHCTLEHLLMIQMNFNLQNAYTEICDQLLSRSFQMVKTNIDDSFIDKMKISLPAHSMQEHLECKEPYSRRITFKSSNKFRHLKTTFFYSVENVCPSELCECFENNEKEMTKENVYYSWVYQKIKTLK